MRLTDLYRSCPMCAGDRLTWRELGVLVRQLPGEARTRIALGDRDGLFGLAEHLQAITIDELRVANWQRANAGLKSHEQSKRPEPFERPGVKRRKQISAADLLAHKDRTRSHAPSAA